MAVPPPLEGGGPCGGRGPRPPRPPPPIPIPMLKPGVVAGAVCCVEFGCAMGAQRSPFQRVPLLHFGRERTGTHFLLLPSQRVPSRQLGCARGCPPAGSHELPFQWPLLGHTQNSPFQTRPLVQAGAQRPPCCVWPSGQVCGGGGTLVVDADRPHEPSGRQQRPGAQSVLLKHLSSLGTGLGIGSGGRASVRHAAYRGSVGQYHLPQRSSLLSVTGAHVGPLD